MARPPDILWIVTTQWRAGAFGHAGDPDARTPALDALAARAVRHGAAVTPHPFGPFARAALLTGVPSPANGVAGYFDPLPAGARTVAHAMGERGYATAHIGKWHLGERDRTALLVGEAHARTIIPEGRRGGFGFWEGFEGGFLLNDPWVHGSSLPVPVRLAGYQPAVLAARFEAWRRGAEAAADRRPWFAVLSVENPHPPYDAPAGDVAPRDPGLLTLAANVPRGGAVEARARRELAGYHAHVEATDRILGGLALGLAGRRDSPVVVVFTSVHGDMHGAHGLFRKGWPHEESVRVPLIVARPGVAPGVDPAPVSLLDLPAATQAWADGREWAPARPWSAISMPEAVGMPLQCDRPWRGVRTAGRKLVLGPDGRPWLHFNLETDPLERVNLAADPAHGDERRALGALMC